MERAQVAEHTKTQFIIVNNLMAQFVRLVLLSQVRGGTRLTLFLAHRLRPLQSVELRLPGGGTLYADLRIITTHALMRNRFWEAGEMAVMRHLIEPNDTIFDVGAHIGTHTVAFSQWVGGGGRVISFEPQPNILPALRLTIQTLNNTLLQTYALSDQTGKAQFYVPDDHAMAGLADWTQGTRGKVRQIECQTHCLDQQMIAQNWPQPDVIKCDVEGAEYHVFRGACQTLNRPDAPILLFESNRSVFSFGLTRDAALTFLRHLKHAQFTFFQVEPNGTILPIKAPLTQHVNVLAVPKAKMHRIEALIPVTDG